MRSPKGTLSLGDTATVMVKPGSDLYRFLVRQRGRSVKITLAESSGRQPPRSTKQPGEPPQPLDHLSDDVVGGRGAGGQPDRERARPGSQPLVHPLDSLTVDGAPTGPVADFRRREQAIRVGDVERRTRSAQILARLHVLLLL